MNKPKKYPPYKVMTKGGAEWIVDANECDVVTRVDMSDHYYKIYGVSIMHHICDKLNELEQ